MATVQLTDIYEPLTFNALIQEKQVQKDAFVQSGVIVDDGSLTSQASAGGRIGDLPNFAPLTLDEANISTDDNTTFSTPANITDQLQKWRLAALNKSWSTMNLSRELALIDPVSAITDRIAAYWVRNKQQRVVNSALGILADNIANDSSDMLYNIATDDAGAITDAERISADAVVLADATMGDRQGEFGVIAVHGAVYAQMRRNNLIDFVEQSDAKTRIPYFLEMRVVVDDNLPAVSGVNRITYTSILFKTGVFGFGHGNVTMPTDVERIPSSGNGGGEEVIYSRESFIIHPYGTSFISGNVAGYSPSWAELALAANWNRIFNRKNVGIAFLRTNG